MLYIDHKKIGDTRRMEGWNALIDELKKYEILYLRDGVAIKAAEGLDRKEKAIEALSEGHTMLLDIIRELEEVRDRTENS